MKTSTASIDLIMLPHIKTQVYNKNHSLGGAKGSDKVSYLDQGKGKLNKYIKYWNKNLTGSAEWFWVKEGIQWLQESSAFLMVHKTKSPDHRRAVSSVRHRLVLWLPMTRKLEPKGASWSFGGWMPVQQQWWLWWNAQKAICLTNSSWWA